MEEAADAGCSNARARLVRLMQHAHAGELAAMYAYRGHAKSVRDPVERAEIERIEEQEAEHRTCVGKILARLGDAPDVARERKFQRIGKTIGLLCRIGGWFVPMYGAGRLERGNIVEYEVAAREAHAAGRPEFVDDLLEMAEVEWDHEQYFRGKVLGHFLRRVFPMWPEPPPRDEIRASFARDVPAYGRARGSPDVALAAVSEAP